MYIYIYICISTLRHTKGVGFILSLCFSRKSGPKTEIESSNSTELTVQIFDQYLKMYKKHSVFAPL